jgi:sporulation protein YlmC with PRC-barrel domain
MLKTLMVTTSVIALTFGAAAAENAGQSKVPAKSPAASTATSTVPKSAEMSKPAPSAQSAKFIGSQRSDQYLASSFKGTDVLGTDNKKIGDVSDILFDQNGKVLAYVVSVGGFLGIGSKNVALEPSAFTVVAGDKTKNETDKLKLAMSQAEIKQAANFKPYHAPPSTTGMGSTSPTRRPAGTAH